MVEYNENNKRKKKLFSLDKPTNADEYNINNEFIRFVRIFRDTEGHDKDDINRLLYREVSLKKVDNKYELNIPQNISYFGMKKYNIKNKLIKYNIINWNSDSGDIINNNFTKLSLSSILGIMGINSLLAISNAQIPLSRFIFYLTFGTFAYAICILAITTITLAILNSITQKDVLKDINHRVLYFLISIFSFIIIRTNSPQFLIESVDSDGITSLTAIQLMSSGILLLLMLLLVRNSINESKEFIKSKYDYAKYVYNKKKGIEYIK